MALIGIGIGIGLFLVGFSWLLDSQFEDGQTIGTVLGILLVLTFGYSLYLRQLLGGHEKALVSLRAELASPGANDRPCPDCGETLNPVAGKGAEPVEGRPERFCRTACDTEFSGW